MRRKLAIAALLLAACHRYKVPREEFLLRLDGPWATPASMRGQRIRSAPATIVYFRDDQEYFELHFTAIEQNDETLYISGNLPRASALGKWKQDGKTVQVTREKISRRDVGQFLCTPLTFQISGGSSMTGNAGGKGDGMYSAVTRLVAPDFQSYLKEARQSTIYCPGYEPKSQ